MEDDSLRVKARGSREVCWGTWERIVGVARTIRGAMVSMAHEAAMMAQQAQESVHSYTFDTRTALLKQNFMSCDACENLSGRLFHFATPFLVRA